MQSTSRLAIPLLSPGQAQKELFHNEALQLLDTLVAPAVEQVERDDPPSSPSEGECYIVGSSPTGEWVGYEQAIAANTAGGWRFISPTEGMSVWVKADRVFAFYRDGQWENGIVDASRLQVGGVQVVGAQVAAVADPAGGATVDVEARTAIAAVTAALRAHGLVASS